MHTNYTAIAALTCSVICATGCSDSLGVDIDDLDRIPPIDSVDYRRITPAADHEYWELRFSFGPGSGTDRILGAGGRRTRAELSAATRTALDAAKPNFGFSAGCLPGSCFKFIGLVNGGVSSVTTVAGLRAFLGRIDSAEEAIILVDAEGYYLGFEPR